MQHFHPTLPTEGSSDASARSQVRAWEQAARTACATIESEDAGVNAASVTLPGGADGVVALLCGVVEEIAAEFGLSVSFKLDGDVLSARFTRDSEVWQHGEHPHKTLRIR